MKRNFFLLLILLFCDIVNAEKESEVSEAMEEGVEEVVETESATMRPITGTMTPLNVIPKESTGTATLRPVQRLTPISTPKTDVKTASITPVLPRMKPADEESDES